MPITTTGANLKLEHDENSGKLRPVWTDGNFVFADDMAEVVLSLLFEEPSWSKPGDVRPPAIRSVKLDTVDALDRIRQYAVARVQRAVDDGRLLSAEVQTERVRRGVVSVVVNYVTRTGRRDLVSASFGGLL